jgi:hypothetical protein
MSWMDALGLTDRVPLRRDSKGRFTSDQNVFKAYSVGVCYASVCTNLSVAEATALLNQEHPTGVGQWALDPEGVFANGAKNPFPCPDDTSCRHLLFSC